MKIREISLSGPRIFANTYADGRSNWEIFPEDGSEEEEDEDESGFKLPRLQFGRIVMNDYPTVSYTNSPQKTGILLRMKEVGFSGRLDKDFAARKNIELKVDSLFAAGRVGPDTLLSGIDRLRLTGGTDMVLKLALMAKAFVGTDGLGRLSLPVEIEGEMQVLKDTVPSFDIRGLKGTLAWIPFELKGQLRSLPDSLDMNMGLDVKGLKPELLLKNYGKQLISPEALKLKTDAVFDASLQAVGSYVYADGALPKGIPYTRVSFFCGWNRAGRQTCSGRHIAHGQPGKNQFGPEAHAAERKKHGFAQRAIKDRGFIGLRPRPCAGYKP